MTDALRDAEAAARASIIDDVIAGTILVDAIAWQLDAYRDAIEKRVREERDAEVRALVERLWGFEHSPACDEQDEDEPCNCGFDAVRATLYAPEEAQP